MKKLLVFTLFIFTLTAFVACNDQSTGSTSGVSSTSGSTTLTIGATPRPHMEILEYIAPYLLAEDGVTLNLIEFTDFFVVNPALADGTLDANFFQHTPFLQASPYANVLEMMGLVHIEPMGMYSLTMNCLACLEPGGVIAIPNDSTNGGRALLLLESHGVIELDPNAGIQATPFDIIYNPMDLVFETLDAAILPRVLDDPTILAAIINTNHVLAGTDLNPLNDSIIIETPDSPYGNGLAIRSDDRDNPALAALLRHLQSERVREFIYYQYEGAVLPVF